MTEKLHTLMREQADAVDFAAPDLDAMIATGDRRVRHRRLGAVAGIAAVVAGVALVAPSLAPDQRGVEPASPDDHAPLSWVEGTTLHEGDRSYDLGFRPRAYVRTAEGYVFSDDAGDVWSWVDGASTKVGRTRAREPRLVADEESGLAGWVDLSDGLDFATVDQGRGDVSTYRLPDLAASSEFYGIDDRTAYWDDREGPAAYDLDSGAQNGRLPAEGSIADVEDDLVAIYTGSGISVRTLDGEQLRLIDGFHGELGSFSDDARYVTNDADEPQVYDIAAGQQVRLDVGERGFATGYEWLGARTLAVLAAGHDGAVAELLVCELPAGECVPTVELGPFDEVTESLVLPVGEPMG